MADKPWVMRTYSGHSTPRATNELYRTNLAKGQTGLSVALSESFDLVVLDWMLPRLDGLTVCRRIREQSIVPILMLTARSEETDIVLGLEVGADDYVTKPFEIDELLARMRALLRRVEGDEVLRVDDLEVNTATHEVRRGGREIELTAREYDLLFEHALGK